jgi:hypothetical protein
MTQDINMQAKPTLRQDQGLVQTVAAIGMVVVVLAECFRAEAPLVFNYMTVVATVAALVPVAQST